MILKETFQHSQKKRHLASSYSTTNIMLDEVLEGLRDRTDAFVNKCSLAKDQSIDTYVCAPMVFELLPANNASGSAALFCSGTEFKPRKFSLNMRANLLIPRIVQPIFFSIHMEHTLSKTIWILKSCKSCLTTMHFSVRLSSPLSVHTKQVFSFPLAISMSKTGRLVYEYHQYTASTSLAGIYIQHLRQA